MLRGVDPSTLRFLARRLLAARGRLKERRGGAEVARQERARTLEAARSALRADQTARLRSEAARRRLLGGTISAVGMAILIAGAEAPPQLQVLPSLLEVFLARGLLVAESDRRAAGRERESWLGRLGRPTDQAVLAGDLGPQWWDSALSLQVEAEAELDEVARRWAELAGSTDPETVESLLTEAEAARRESELRCAAAEAEALSRALVFDAGGGEPG